MRLIRSFRYLLARSLFLAMGLRITYWRKAVERAWAMESREEYLDSILTKVAPRDANGKPVRTVAELEAAPILTKKAFRQSASRPNKSAVFHRHTAGSSGDPTSIWLNRQELGRMLGVRDYCYRHCGIRVGEREGRLWGRPESGLKRRLKNFMLNRRVFHTSGRNLEKEVKELVEWRPDYLYGYASLLMECAGQLDQTRQSVPDLKCVIVTAETILSSQKEYLSGIFCCPVLEEYGASEFDIIAFECHYGHRHLVNPWLFVETSEAGTARVSDTFRSTQSVTRYELGDSITLATSECSALGDCLAIEGLQGRTLNQFAIIGDSQKFHSVEFSYALDNYQRENLDFFRFQIVQEKPSEFKFYLKPFPKSGFEDLSEYISRFIEKRTGHYPFLKLEGELDERNEKLTYFVQNMNL